MPACGLAPTREGYRLTTLLPHFAFLDGSIDPGSAFSGSYSWPLVLLSVLIASLAAYAALGGADRINASKSVAARYAWLASGALSMGIGVWAMHFIAMLAFTLPVTVSYDVLVTTVSMIPAILASGLVLFLLSRDRIGIWQLVYGGVLMGAGIGLMHYIGMAAMRMDALMGYDPIMFGVSVLVAVVLAIMALYTKFLATSSSRSLFHWSNFAAAVVMGLAVAGMHYTGMAAAYFFPGSGGVPAGDALDPVWLGSWVSLATLLIISLSILVIIVDRRLESARKQREELERLVKERTSQLAVANAQVTALNEQLLSENVRMGAELDVTRRLQMMLLPSEEELRTVAGLDIACFMQAADEVGGDYYDILQHDGRVKIGIGDVTGHGLESGVLMVMTQAIVRALLISGETDPVRFLTVLNYALYGNVKRMGSDKNLTLCLLDYASGEIRLSGQHEEMIVVRSDGSIEMVNTIDLGFPIALENEITDFIDHTTILLRPGDGVVLYTDGVTEAENAGREQYGIERLCSVLRDHWVNSAEKIKQAVVDDVRQYIGEHTVYDDITLVVAKQR